MSNPPFPPIIRGGGMGKISSSLACCRNSARIMWAQSVEALKNTLQAGNEQSEDLGAIPWRQHQSRLFFSSRRELSLKQHPAASESYIKTNAPTPIATRPVRLGAGSRLRACWPDVRLDSDDGSFGFTLPPLPPLLGGFRKSRLRPQKGGGKS